MIRVVFPKKCHLADFSKTIDSWNMFPGKGQICETQTSSDLGFSYFYLD